MKPLRRLLDKLHHSFAKGGKYERFYPVYEAVDTFLYTPGSVTKTASHVRDGMDMKRVMIIVCVALLPCVFMAFWNTGYQANTVIHNRKQAQRLLDADVIQSSEIGTVLQVSIGLPLERDVDEITSALVRKRAQNYLAGDEARETIETRTRNSKTKSREEVEQELYETYTSNLEGDLKDSLALVLIPPNDQPAVEVELTKTGYTPGWRGRLMESMGLNFDPTSFLSNLIFGGLFFLPVYLVCMAVGGIWETIFSVVRGHEINEGFLVTGLLFPLTLPPTIPLWQVALGISFGVVIGKEIFGGTGRNFLNPALTARAFLYFAYPAQSTGEGIWNAVAVDGFSGATTLGVMATANMQDVLSSPVESVANISFWQAFSGTIQGSMGETSTLACIFGAIVLIGAGVGSWRIMAGMLIGGMGFSAFLWLIGSETNPMFALPPWWHLAVGSFAFGLVFMATDPVSASMTQVGKWWYGGLIGAMTILVRVINPAFPEGVMLAILFGNVFAPLIDYFVVQANIKRRLARNGA